MAIKYKIHFTKSAEHDITQIFDYIATVLQVPNSAKKLMSEIDKKINALSEFPFVCPIIDDERLQHYQCRKLIINNFLAIYTVNEKEQAITIMRLFYGRSDYIGKL